MLYVQMVGLREKDEDTAAHSSDGLVGDNDDGEHLLAADGGDHASVAVRDSVCRHCRPRIRLL